MIKQHAVVIGNGESRKNLNLQRVKDKFITIGCNALHRDIAPDHLICCDQRMVNECLDNENVSSSLVYVREEWYHTYKKLMKYKNVRSVPNIPYEIKGREDEPRNWGSGPYAMLVASDLNVDTIYVVGFDLYGNGSSVNNIYKGTENYSPKNSRAVDPSYWIYQLAKVFYLKNDKKFVIVNFNDWNFPAEWNFSNVSFMETKTFESVLQSQ